MTPSRLRALAPRLFVLAALAFLAGCRSKPYRASLVVPQGYHAEVVVQGEHPRVRLESEGPGWIRMQVEAAGFSISESVLAAGAAMWSYPGPIRLVLTETGHGSTVVHVEASGATGLAIHGAKPPAPE